MCVSGENNRWTNIYFRGAAMQVLLQLRECRTFSFCLMWSERKDEALSNKLFILMVCAKILLKGLKKRRNVTFTGLSSAFIFYNIMCIIFNNMPWVTDVHFSRWSISSELWQQLIDLFSEHNTVKKTCISSINILELNRSFICGAVVLQHVLCMNQPFVILWI